MSSGPSKEDLEMYWKTSRQYFDELASYYRTSDPGYYSQYIAPFYSNPLNSVSSPKKSSGGLTVFVAVFLLVIMGIIGGAVYFISSTGSQEKSIERKNEPVSKPDIKESLPDDEFIIGSKYIEEKEYDKAEEHLKKVNKDSQYYEMAQELLKNMKYLRKYDPKKNK